MVLTNYYVNDFLTKIKNILASVVDREIVRFMGIFCSLVILQYMNHSPTSRFTVHTEFFIYFLSVFMTDLLIPKLYS